MAAFDYEGMAASATSMLERFGTSVDLLPRVVTGPKNNPAVTFPNALPTLGVILAFKAKEIDGERITERDRKVLLASDQQEPQIKDRLRVGGVDYEIVQVAPLRPATTTLMYTLQIRG